MRQLAAILLLLAMTAPGGSRADDTTAQAAPARPASGTAIAKAAPTRVASNGSAGQAHDRLELDATSITGDRELPKVMSIVPWKGAEPPGGPDRPMGTLVDELIAPIDRDEFRREIIYYRDLTNPQNSAPAAGGRVTPGVTKQ